tara:strand:+ start:3835 stop:4575 length:741 start_codon:yes stop_codon:yes gene_type:complete
MIKRLKRSSTIDLMTKTLSEDGVFIIENYISGTQLNRLVEETMNKIKNEGTEYPFGISYRGPNIRKFDEKSEIKKIFNVDWMKQLFYNYTGESEENFGEDVFSTYDYKKTKNIARNGYLHYDRKSALKFFIYLSNVNSDNGAFVVAPKSNKYGKKIRLKEWGSNKAHRVYDNNLILKKLLFQRKYNKIKNRVEHDEINVDFDYETFPVESNAGSMIVFDSDTLHKGGIIKNNTLERLVLRLHCYKI